MATFEQIKLALQAQQILENLRSNMRANAQSYLDGLSAGTGVAPLIALAKANTTQYARILGWLQAANQNATVKAKVQAGLTALSLLFSDLTAAFSELSAAATAEQTAGATAATAQDLTALATATLAAIAVHDSIWPNG